MNIPIRRDRQRANIHLHKIFSSVTELSITEYIRKRRLTMAHKILCETTETVADICYTFGMQPLVARERVELFDCNVYSFVRDDLEK